MKIKVNKEGVITVDPQELNTIGVVEEIYGYCDTCGVSIVVQYC